MANSNQNARWEELLHAINHDLRTPLGNIRSAIAILQQDLSTQISDDQRIFIEIIERSTTRLLDQSNRLLLFGEIAFGQSAPEKIRLSELLANTRRALKNSYAIEQVTLIAAGDPHVPCRNYTLSTVLALLAAGDTKQQDDRRLSESPTIETTAENEQVHFIIHSLMPAQDLAASFTEVTSAIVALHGGTLEHTVENGRFHFTFSLPQIPTTD